jgi:hypothetical protein
MTRSGVLPDWGSRPGICWLRWLTFLDRSFCSFNVPLRLESSIGATRKSGLNDAAATEGTKGCLSWRPLSWPIVCDGIVGVAPCLRIRCPEITPSMSPRRCHEPASTYSFDTVQREHRSRRRTCQTKVGLGGPYRPTLYRRTRNSVAFCRRRRSWRVFFVSCSALVIPRLCRLI